MAVYDLTPDGVPLPHPDNPAREDAGRVRSALTLLAAAKVAAATAIGNLQTAVAGKIGQAELDAAILALIGGAPGALNTLDELAAALADDASFAGTVTNALAGKAPIGHAHDERYYTEAEVDALISAVGGEWVQVGATATISSPVASVGWTTGLTGRRDLLLEVAGLTHDQSASGFGVQLSANGGSTWGTPAPISQQTLSSSQAASGAVRMLGRDRDFSVWLGGLPVTPAELAVATAGVQPNVARHTGGFNALRIVPLAGLLTAGTVKLFRRG